MNGQGNTTLLDDNRTDNVLVNMDGYDDVEPNNPYYYSYYSDWDDMKTRARLIYGYVTLSIAIIGILGNIVTIIVFQKGRRCSNSWCALYFKALAIADIYVLVSSALQHSLDTLGYIDTYYTDKTMCAFNHFNFDFCIQTSTWITVTITIDRAITVSYPLKARNIATRKWMYIKLTIIVLVFTAINLAVVSKLQYGNYSMCGFDSRDMYYFIHYLISEGVLVFFLPATINIVCNVIILRALYRRASNATQMGLAESHVTSRRGDANAVMYRVIAIGVVHLVSTIPAIVHLLVFSIRKVTIHYDIINPKAELISGYVNVGAFYLMSGVNFLFYGMMGNDFRQDLKYIMCFLPTRGQQARSVSQPTRHTGGTDTSTV